MDGLRLSPEASSSWRWIRLRSPYPDQGYGKKLVGGNHSRIEGPYILYNPTTEYTTCSSVSAVWTPAAGTTYGWPGPRIPTDRITTQRERTWSMRTDREGASLTTGP